MIHYDPAMRPLHQRTCGDCMTHTRNYDNTVDKGLALIVDADSTIPNIACMRLYHYYQSLGWDVDFIRLGISIYDKPKPIEIDNSKYDLTFASMIFKGTIDNVLFKTISNLDIGGTGSNKISKKLPKEIESCECDYSIYPDNDTSYGFISRGCIRNCGFCLVREKEGALKQVTKISDIVKHKKVKFLDNNFLALPNHEELLHELIDKKLRCQFNQGLDIRLVNDMNAELLSKLNYMGEYIFAFDSLEIQPIVERKLAILKKYIQKDWKIKFFIYCHPDMDIPTNVYHRVLWCKENKVLPYFMRHQDCWKSENVRTYNDFSAWCNQPGIFKSHTYEQFCRKRRPQPNRSDVLPDWFVPRVRARHVEMG